MLSLAPHSLKRSARCNRHRGCPTLGLKIFRWVMEAKQCQAVVAAIHCVLRQSCRHSTQCSSMSCCTAAYAMLLDRSRGRHAKHAYAWARYLCCHKLKGCMMLRVICSSRLLACICLCQLLHHYIVGLSEATSIREDGSCKTQQASSKQSLKHTWLDLLHKPSRLNSRGAEAGTLSDSAARSSSRTNSKKRFSTTCPKSTYRASALVRQPVPHMCDQTPSIVPEHESR